MRRLKSRYNGLEDRTHVCCKRRGWRVGRGERPINLGDSWFSAKRIEVRPFTKQHKGVEHSLRKGGPKPYQTQGISEYLCCCKTRQTVSAKVHRQRGNSPYCMQRSQSQVMSGKGCISTWTARRWAWKQPSFEERVLAHWSSRYAPKMYRGSITAPKQQVSSSYCWMWMR